MQHYTIERLEDLPVILTVYHAEFGGRDDVLAYSEDIARTFANLKTPMYNVSDFRNIKLSMSDILLSIKRGANSDDSILKSPMHTAMVMITKNMFYTTVVNTMLKAPFNLPNVYICETLDEALELVRDKSEEKTS